MDSLILNRYEPIDRIATTGLATLYRARDTDNNTIISLKVLHPYVSEEHESLKPFLQEMDRVQRLRHPGIVASHGIQQGNQLTAIATDYIPWPSLKFSSARILPLAQILTIIRQVAAALDYAHSQGIVHRDLRPSNVFFNQDSNEVVISDFGIATLIENGHPLVRSTVNTPAPGYASPEQIQGNTPTSSNDIYALGVLIYELSTGEIPYDALSPLTILSRQLVTTATRPSQLNEALPADLDDVVLRALNRQPESRYSSCQELAEAFEKVVRSHTFQQPVEQSPLEYQEAMAAATNLTSTKIKEAENSRLFCPHCGSGNPALLYVNPRIVPRCINCWGSLTTQPIISQEEEKQLVHRYLRVLRKRKRLLLGMTWGTVAMLLGFWAYSITDIRPPLPPSSTSITSESAALEWSMVQRDAMHTGVAPGQAFIPKETIKWKFESNAPILATPAVARGSVYLATGDRRVVALDANTGTVQWTHPVNGPINSSPAVAGDLVFSGLRDGTLLALDADTGVLRWSYKTDGPIYGSATITDGTLYIGSTDSRLYAFDAQTGDVRWIKKADNWILGSPTISNGIVVFGAQDRNLYMVDASNGTSRHVLGVGGSVDNAVTLAGDIAFFTTRSGHVIAFNYEQKDIPFQKAIWRVWFQLWLWQMTPRPPDVPGWVWGNHIGAQSLGNLAIADERLFVSTLAGTIHAINSNTGTTIWEVDDIGRLYSSPIITGTTIIQAGSTGNVYGFDTATGEEKWKLPVDGAVIASPILAGNTLYVPTNKGTLYAFN